MFKVKDKFDEIFKVEIEAWCYGIATYPAEIFPALIHRVVKELGVTFREAIINHMAFDVIDVATKISKAGKYLVDEKEIAFSILAQLPNPNVLDEEGQYVLANVIDQVEQAYGGALERLQRRWAHNGKKEAA
jgi:hypothetical protein